MAWEKLGTASVGGSVANTSWKEVGRTTLDSVSQNITCSFTPKDNMMFLYSRTDSTNATSNGLFRLGYDSVVGITSNTNYAAHRYMEKAGWTMVGERLDEYTFGKDQILILKKFKEDINE